MFLGQIKEIKGLRIELILQGSSKEIYIFFLNLFVILRETEMKKFPPLASEESSPRVDYFYFKTCFFFRQSF